jgi:predicted metal-dependent HD superfamily phosphohydrolase
MSEEASFTLPDSKLSVLWERWTRLTANAATEHSERTFQELSRLYSSPHRAYHNLSHVNALLEQAIPMEEKMQNPAAVYFAIWFHDAVYETSRKDNEERSAEMAQASMTALGASSEIIPLVHRWILATKSHRPEDDLNDDGKLFLDLDLSILGSAEEIYRIYARAIRKEYWWVPKMIYRRERKKVLENFLRRDRIYSTDVMFEARESQARRNIEAELALD